MDDNVVQLSPDITLERKKANALNLRYYLAKYLIQWQLISTQEVTSVAGL